jgi:hypothetical protein
MGAPLGRRPEILGHRAITQFSLFLFNKVSIQLITYVMLFPPSLICGYCISNRYFTHSLHFY